MLSVTGSAVTIADECTTVLLKGSPERRFTLNAPTTAGANLGQLLIVINNSDSPSDGLVTMGSQSRIFIYDGEDWQ